MNEIKACPFCSHVPDYDDSLEFHSDPQRRWGSVYCSNCGINGPTIPTHSNPVSEWKNDAILVWNKRGNALWNGA